MYRVIKGNSYTESGSSDLDNYIEQVLKYCSDILHEPSNIYKGNKTISGKGNSYEYDNIPIKFNYIASISNLLSKVYNIQEDNINLIHKNTSVILRYNGNNSYPYARISIAIETNLPRFAVGNRFGSSNSKDYQLYYQKQKELDNLLSINSVYKNKIFDNNSSVYSTDLSFRTLVITCMLEAEEIYTKIDSAFNPQKDELNTKSSAYNVEYDNEIETQFIKSFKSLKSARNFITSMQWLKYVDEDDIKEAKESYDTDFPFNIRAIITDDNDKVIEQYSYYPSDDSVELL